MYHDANALQERTRNLVYRVYLWMSLGLVITAATALLMGNNVSWLKLIARYSWLMVALLIIQLVVAVIFATMLPKLSYRSALVLFIVYTIICGSTLASLFWLYTLSSILQTLMITVAMFAGAAVYGYVTKTDLSRLRSIVFMALWGFIIALLVNLFLRNSWFSLVISCVGVVLFTVLTAYDMYIIKHYAMEMEAIDSEDYAKVGLFGAFQLYLDFVNLFLSLLNITGKRRE